VDRPQTHRSVRQISRETGIRHSSVHNIIKQDLRLKCLKKKAAQELTVANKQAKLERCRQLLRKYPPHAVHFIWFSDEKLFTVAAPSNLLNYQYIVYYCIWGMLQERVYCLRIHDVKEFKERLLREWRLLDHTVIAALTAQWHSRLNACVRVNGGHFEHKFWASDFLLFCLFHRYWFL